jgi:hypothetical protein
MSNKSYTELVKEGVTDLVELKKVMSPSQIEFAETFLDLVEEGELDEDTIHLAYSGRGMFGRLTIGATVSRITGGPSARLQAIRGARIDNMGLDFIVYIHE